jgi:hypothetical protein
MALEQAEAEAQIPPELLQKEVASPPSRPEQEDRPAKRSKAVAKSKAKSPEPVPKPAPDVTMVVDSSTEEEAEPVPAQQSKPVKSADNAAAPASTTTEARSEAFKVAEADLPRFDFGLPKVQAAVMDDTRKAALAVPLDQLPRVHLVY